MSVSRKYLSFLKYTIVKAFQARQVELCQLDKDSEKENSHWLRGLLLPAHLLLTPKTYVRNKGQ